MRIILVVVMDPFSQGDLELEGVIPIVAPDRAVCGNLVISPFLIGGIATGATLFDRQALLHGQEVFLLEGLYDRQR